MNGFFIATPVTEKFLSHLNLRHLEVQELAYTDLAPGQEITMPPARVKKYAGARLIPWSGPIGDTPPLQDWMHPIPGVAGIQTPSYRALQLAADRAIAEIYLRINWHFYIRLEVGIDVLGDHPKVAQAWQQYLIDVCKMVHSIRPGAQILWSPYAWDLWDSVSATRRQKIAASLKTMMTQVKTLSGTPGITYLDLQDGRGAQPNEPETDAVNWYNLIKGCGPTVRINMEYFTYKGNNQFVGNGAQEMNRRLAFYRLNNVPIGVCWEISYW